MEEHWQVYLNGQFTDFLKYFYTHISGIYLQICNHSAMELNNILFVVLKRKSYVSLQNTPCASYLMIHRHHCGQFSVFCVFGIFNLNYSKVRRFISVKALGCWVFFKGSQLVEYHTQTSSRLSCNRAAQSQQQIKQIKPSNYLKSKMPVGVNRNKYVCDLWFVWTDLLNTAQLINAHV